MNHQEVYNNIIEKTRNQKRSREDKVYYENHHIIPRCINGSDDEYNLVLLTAREHFVCHKLLTYIHLGNRKIALAFHLMTFMNKRKYGITSRDYAYARELISLIPMSKETKQKISKNGKDKKHKKFSEEGKKNISIAAKNRPPCSNETKYKKGNGMRGKNHKSETIEKMKNTEHNISPEGLLNLSLANKGKTRSKETIEKIKQSLKNYYESH